MTQAAAEAFLSETVFKEQHCVEVLFARKREVSG